MSDSAEYDAVIVGSGISGLLAGIRLQRAGIRSLILEKGQRAGGLCGTFQIDGHEFVIGCNDFGTGMQRELDELGVDVSFLHPRARFHFAAKELQLPPDRATLLALAARPLALWRLIRGAKRAVTLGALVDDHIDDPLLKDAACLPAFAMMRSPDDVSLSTLAREFSKDLGYGYDKSCTPVGGPQLLVDRMVRRFSELGGTLRLGSEFRETRRSSGGHEIVTAHGLLSARALLMSTGRWRDYPSGTKSGLEVAAALCVLDTKELVLPESLHTLDWFEPGVARMLRQLDRGEPDSAPSFHAFRSDLPIRNGCFSLNAFVPLARGEHDLSETRRDELSTHVRAKLEQLCPGFTRAERAFHLLSPREVFARVGVTLAPSPRVPPLPFEKPPSYDPEREIHYLGTSVDPPGEHAGAAAVSARRAAERVIANARGQRSMRAEKSGNPDTVERNLF